MSVISDLLDRIENIGNPMRETFKALGRRYNLRASEVQIFETLWPVWKQVFYTRMLHKGKMKDAVAAYYPALRNIAARGSSDLVGLQRVARRGDNRKYVIFSDHHMLHRNHRHDYFFTFGNQRLYKDILEEYAKCGYTLVENGDVEELLIMEPHPWMAANWRACVSNMRLDLERLEAVRKHFRERMLDNIINANEDLYDHINTLFHQKGRYVRLTGNHDTYLDPDLVAKLQAKYPGLPISDVLAVHAMDASETTAHGSASWLITHGHQFDTATTPPFAQRVGELNSETLSWIFEGPDRKWDWNDDVRNWISGSEDFSNRLANGHADNFFNPDRGTAAEKAFVAAFIESLFGHEIAWEYFERSDRWDAFWQEVVGLGLSSGNEFLKIRHLSEEDVCRDYTKEMWNHRTTAPNLVFGHTHEPRHNALCHHNLVWSRYYNSGSAGRFENLIFGIEIENGEARIISWHSEDGPNTAKLKPRRRIWTPDNDKFSVSSGHEPLCAVEPYALDPSLLSSEIFHEDVDGSHVSFDPEAWSGLFPDPSEGPYYPQAGADPSIPVPNPDPDLGMFELDESDPIMDPEALMMARSGNFQDPNLDPNATQDPNLDPNDPNQTNTDPDGGNISIDLNGPS